MGWSALMGHVQAHGRAHRSASQRKHKEELRAQRDGSTGSCRADMVLSPDEVSLESVRCSDSLIRQNQKHNNSTTSLLP